MVVGGAEELLEQLGRGEPGVAEGLYSAYNAYIRAVVRRQLSDQLRSRVDSADVVQSVWAQVVREIDAGGWQVASEPQLRALLAVIARRRVVNRARAQARSIPTEQPDSEEWKAVESADQTRPSQIAQAGELWDRLLNLCPPEHRDVLQLRREGLTLDEVAARTGLHEGSVRRILRQLSRDLARHNATLTPMSAG